MKKFNKRIITAVIASALIAGVAAGCGSGAQVLDLTAETPTVRLMTSAYQSKSAGEDSAVYQALEEYLGVDLDLVRIYSNNYDEKVTATMGAGDRPMLMRVGSKTSSVIQNSRAGTFWEVGDKMMDSEKYPYLSQANPMINHNIAIDNKIYGLYCARDLGRAGVSIREDWLDNLGMDYPTTIAEFEEVLRAFTEDDPDGNGIDDTYGMIVTSYSGPLDNLIVWCGAPNEWGYNEETQRLEPDFMFPEYMDALNLIKKWFQAGYINQDMATRSSDKWDEDFLAGNAGVIIDVADRARRLQTNIASADPDAVVGIFGSVAVDENSERRVKPTTGYNGFFVVPTASVPTEEGLEFILSVCDKMLSPDGADLINYGIKDRNYVIDEEGYLDQTPSNENASLAAEYADLNQITTLIGGQTNLKTRYLTKVAEDVELVMEDNANYAVANPAESYVSQAYSLSGTQMDAIISEANTKYMTGQITEEEWQSSITRWEKMGGSTVIEEMNEAYDADTSEYKTVK